MLLNKILNEFEKDEDDLKFKLFALQDNYGKTAFHYLFEISEEVLKKIGPYQYSSLSNTFIDGAPKKYIPDLLSIKDVDGNNAFYSSLVAFENDFIGVLQLINRIPLDQRKPVLEISLDKMGNTLLHKLARNNQESELIQVLESVDIDDREYLLEVKNKSKIDVIDVIEDYEILDIRLDELVSILGNTDFANTLYDYLSNSVYDLWDE